ncbi:MAG: hypothetical protein D3910_24025 [Candidatus Electrothrix sp. ATG2]|nr:hypothetical protein [Candidatus Electrothrix sp. ATG2]
MSCRGFRCPKVYLLFQIDLLRLSVFAKCNSCASEYYLVFIFNFNMLIILPVKSERSCSKSPVRLLTNTKAGCIFVVFAGLLTGGITSVILFDKEQSKQLPSRSSGAGQHNMKK